MLAPRKGRYELEKEKLLAVGGGSIIDSSKAIAAGAIYDGDFWDFYSGGGRNGSISGFVTLSEEDCEKIYRMMV